MAETVKLFVGLDVGGTSVKEGLFTEEGALIARASVPTPPLIDGTGYDAVCSGIDELVGQANATVEDVYGIGLAVPCPVPADGEIRLQANIQLNAPGLMRALETRCPHAAIKFGNDANAAAMGELWRGTARGKQSMVMVTLGTGVGGGVVVGGDVVEGFVGAAGEIGHLCMNPDEGRTCGCGGRGHLEQYASATGIVTSYRDECAKRGADPVELSGPSDSRAVFEAYAAGDEAAGAAVSTMCEYLGRALSVIAAVVDPEVFVLGGGVSNSASQYLDELYAAYRRYAISVCADTPIEIASLGNDAGIFGAAYMALRAAEA